MPSEESADFVEAGGRSRFVVVADGVRLHARDYDPGGEATPVLCLPGLARTGLDFDPLARALSEGRFGARRRVVCLDYRGRGRSELDPNGVYDLLVENADALAVATALDVSEAFVVGTSRGGLHAMAMGATRPTFLRGVVLNDVGPRIETQGLLRIRAYVGKLPRLATLEQATAMMRDVMGAQFPALGDEDWRFFAATTFRQGADGLVGSYDPRLSAALEALDLTQPLPEMWPQFDSLAHVPVLALRGETSDLLSDATLQEMAARHPRATTRTVPGQGHAPLLRDVDTMKLIAERMDVWSAA